MIWLGAMCLLLPVLRCTNPCIPAARLPRLSACLALQVREFESSASLFAESRAKRGELQDALKEYEGELKALRQEMDMQVGG